MWDIHTETHNFLRFRYLKERYSIKCLNGHVYSVCNYIVLKLYLKFHNFDIFNTFIMSYTMTTTFAIKHRFLMTPR